MNRDSASSTFGYRRWQFSLLGLLVFMTFAALLLGLWRATRTYRVTAYLQVSSPLEARLTPRLVAGRVDAQLELITSQAVLSAALSAPAVAELRQVRDQLDPVAWLADRLEASFPGEGEIMEIRMQGRGLESKSDQRLLNAVIDAYKTAAETPGSAGSAASDPVPAVKIIQRAMVVPQSR